MVGWLWLVGRGHDKVGSYGTATADGKICREAAHQSKGVILHRTTDGDFIYRLKTQTEGTYR